MAVAVSLPPRLEIAPSHEHLSPTTTGAAIGTEHIIGGSSTVTTSSSDSPPQSPSAANAGSSFAVPYPYSVSLPFMPNSNANISGYFAGSSNQPLPDDSDVQTRLPSICVDYLSHDWVESDIWKSWRAMTKHKAELANGVRLENASWRTWAKQRNKLRTISPETLNWLKDSDVTWLYGPLHTAVDPVPPARAATMEDRLNLDPQTQARHAATPLIRRSSDVRATTAKATRNLQPTKPILKYRSLSDILSVPTHRHLAEYNYEEGGEDSSDDRIDPVSTPRPGMPHMRSDTAVPRAGGRRTPTPVATDRGADRHDTPEAPPTPSDRSASADELEPPRKHISFNHFVEQCIAVDSDDDPSLFESGSSATSEEEEDDDDEDEALSFRSSPRSAAFPLAKTQPLHFDRDKEPHTIAKLAPTVLKSSELVYPSPSPAVVFNGQIINESHPFSIQGANGVHFDTPEHTIPLPIPNTTKWEHDEDYSSGRYDEYSGDADLGVGDEYTAANGAQGHPHARKGVSRTPTDQSPVSSAGPSSPNLLAVDAARSSTTGRSILKSRGAGPYHGEVTGNDGPGPLVVQTSPTASSYADAVKGLPSPVQPRGRSISRGSSSSSLDRSASADGRRSSPHIGAEPERGRTFRRNNSSASSLNNLGTSPSSAASSDATLSARVRREAETEQAPSSIMGGESSATASTSSSSASLPSRDEVTTPRPSLSLGEPPDMQHKDLGLTDDFAHDADFDKDTTFLFDSPHMPSSPTSSSMNLPRNNSFSTALASVRWSDDEPSAARRALLRAQSRDSAASGVGRRFSQGSDLVDDYGLNFASFSSDDEESGGIVGRAVEIVGTARDLVGALWTVAFRR